MLNRFKARLEGVLDRAVGDRLPLNPNHVTLLSLALSALTPLAATAGAQPPHVALLLLLSALLDALDGYIARRRGLVTKFGAFLDSTVDRLSDALHTYALFVCGVLELPLAYALLVAEYLVSYTRARAESLGISLSGVGLMERGERVIAKALALALQAVHPPASRAVAYALLALTSASALQRVRVVARHLG